MHVLPDYAVRGAECTNTHLLCNRLPVIQGCVQEDHIYCTFPMEFKCFQIIQDKVTLCCLIELELDHLWAVFGSPKVGDLRNGFDRHTTLSVLFKQKPIGRDTDH